MTFAPRVTAYILNTDNDEVISADLATYFSLYRGRRFDELSWASRSDRFTTDDVAALATLSVPLSGKTVTQLLFDRAHEFTSLIAGLSELPTYLWEVSPADLAAGGPMDKMYTALKSLDDVAMVRASKLFACKRPHLVPVRDSLVEVFVGAANSSRWWSPMRDIVSDEGVRTRLIKLSPPGLPDYVSVLRRLDVVLWMRGEAKFHLNEFGVAVERPSPIDKSPDETDGIDSDGTTGGSAST